MKHANRKRLASELETTAQRMPLPRRQRPALGDRADNVDADSAGAGVDLLSNLLFRYLMDVACHMSISMGSKKGRIRIVSRR